MTVDFYQVKNVTNCAFLRHVNVLAEDSAPAGHKHRNQLERGGVGRSISSCFSPFMRRGLRFYLREPLHFLL